MYRKAQREKRSIAKHRFPFLPFPCLLRSYHRQISQDAFWFDHQNALKYKPSGTSPFYPARYVWLLIIPTIP